jgi:hypothetical protein
VREYPEIHMRARFKEAKLKWMWLTFIRYSTARSGLLKLARRARITCSRSNPISIMLFTVVCKAEPVTKEGSPASPEVVLPESLAGGEAAAEVSAGAVGVVSVVVGGAGGAAAGSDVATAALEGAAAGGGAGFA